MDLIVRIRNVVHESKPMMFWTYGTLTFSCPVPNSLPELLIKSAEAFLYLGHPDMPFFDPSMAAWKDWQLRPRVTVELEGTIRPDRTTDWYVIICEYGGQGHTLPKVAKEPITGNVGHWYDVIFACGACTRRFNDTFGREYTLKDLGTQLRRAYDCVRRHQGT